MSSLKNNINDFDHAELLRMIEYLQSNLHRRTEQLQRARTTVSGLRSRLNRMKTMLANQRQRILELYQMPSQDESSIDVEAATPIRDE
ncbi:hypothetical protein [Chryseolinea lacunae]|uniref:50S ribosomal protein L29 n=1 Tax=Chryseolinea lacunae TaxID=2801331 RepID=A0ABS1KVB5_9BACT|nr:hypothetical protein [Chryseolinea lacunae]MBL0743143.1 hypothetical protein [Chryseolinea lacunae]